MASPFLPCRLRSFTVSGRGAEVLERDAAYREFRAGPGSSRVWARCWPPPPC